MIKPEMVPYNATREALTAWMGSEGTIMSAMERAIAAALNAWPGMHTHEWQRPWLGGMSGTDLILPLMERRDDQ